MGNNFFSIFLFASIFQVFNLSAMAEGQDGHTNPREVEPSGSPRLSPRCSPTQTWLQDVPPLRPPWSSRPYEQDDSETPSNEPLPSSGLYEELFCSGRLSLPLAGALMASSRPRADVVMEGYLGKLEQNHRRYFVLRAGSHTGPSRLEWFKSREKFAALEKSAGKAPLLGSNKQGLVDVTNERV